MAEFRFFNIGKANAEIERLDGELKAAQTKVSELTQHALDVETAAETLKTNLQSERDKSASLQVKLQQTESDLSTAKQTIGTLEKRIENPSAEVARLASQKAATIVASQGIHAVAQQPGKQTLQVNREQFEAMSPDARKQHLKAGGRVI